MRSRPLPPAQQPPHRPAWLLVLGALMGLAGGMALKDGLQKLRSPQSALTPVVGGSAGSEEELELGRKLAAACTSTVAPRETAVRVVAGVELAMALFTLYATAAVLSRDRRGRTLALAVAVVGIVYQLATLPVYIDLMRAYAAASAPLLAQALMLQMRPGDDGHGPSVDDLVRRLPSAIVGGTVAVTALGIAGSLVLLVYFGGWRGRVLYGLEPPRQKERRPGRMR